MKFVKGVIGALIIAGGVACTSDELPTAAKVLGRTDLESHLRAATAETRGFEDDILALDRELGGVGGVYVDGSGALVVGVTEGARVDGVNPSVTRRWTNSHPMIARENGTARAVRIVPMQFRFSDLVAYSQVALESLAGAKDMVSLDADERANRVRVVVSSRSAHGDVMKRLVGAGIPRAAINIEDGAPMHLMGNLKDKWRPTRGGIQIWSPVAQVHCSLGFNVTRNQDAKRYLLTASHCSNKWHADTGLVIYQNNADAGNRVGVVAINPSWYSLSGCVGGFDYCTSVDAMLVLYDEGIEAPSKISKTENVGYTSPGSIVNAGWWDPVFPAGWTEPGTGVNVDKVGRTSGWTRGPIQNTCVTAWGLQYGFTYGVYCLVEVQAYADYGDSGGSVFTLPGGLYDPNVVRVPLGILAGGNGLTGSSARMYYTTLGRIQIQPIFGNLDM